MSYRIKRKTKVTRKYRGTRSCGGGNAKNRRGSGCTGGMGRGGSNKHKFSKYYQDFGRRGFNRSSQEETKAINVIELAQLEASGLAKNEGAQTFVDLEALGYKKLLSKGRAAKAFKVRVESASVKAVEKIQKAGGSVELLALASEAVKGA